MFDVIIIGAGPTGLTAAIYATRRMMKTLVISKDIGGQIIWTSEIENYPGIKLIKGTNLVTDIYEQAKSLGAKIRIAEVSQIIRQDDGNFVIQANQEKYESKTVIIAMGLMPKVLSLPNEREFVGRGISYCANCDAPLFKGKTVAVIGGGNAALDAAEVLSKIARNVYLVYHKSKFKGFEILIDEVKNKENVKVILESDIIEISGKQKLEKIKVVNHTDQTMRWLEVDGLFVEIGHQPKTDLVADLVERDGKGQIIVDLCCRTSLEGMFAAGDVTQIEFKQIVIGCGQGAVAALSAYKYLQGKK
ncbi:thioredoxin-disulfide reductase [Candidatus Falkowbacteria bacterium RIFCSPLOWO2_12_FULL_45_13]|uniref:Thioredoxin reductase n=2 Tax=Candidatus Falkowiibacteriota TaxID=1752728 RepID=A0A1F5SCN2_9BACT|nr:MAG: thioredoxin-disulfide reductase [Candidatus Falkowbacteria bacterium RIFCSPLOWO2_02_FULL_45_21]OGF31046.1 MAG: thioredoxin-disulfide reductase [Candidatus Falkowbacteria bacterium RIFCSPLOWO2_12_FULL_45_13]